MSKVHGLQGALTVTVHRCRDLKDTQIVGKQDPYCKVRLGNEKFKTKVAEDGGRAPVWNQMFLFNLDAKTEEQDMIHFEVLHSALGSDDLIGRADIKILELVKQLNQKKFIQIVDKDNFTKMCGQLEVTVEFKGTGLPESSAAPVTATVTPTPAPVVQQPVVQPVVQQQPIQQVQQQPIQQQYQQQPQFMQQQQQPQMYGSQPIMQQPMYGSQPIMQQPQMMYQPMMQQPLMPQPMMMFTPQQQQQPMMMQQQPQMQMQGGMMQQPLSSGMQMPTNVNISFTPTPAPVTPQVSAPVAPINSMSTTVHDLRGSGWQQLPSAPILAQAEIGTAGQIVGCSKTGTIHVYWSGSWHQLDGAAKHATVASTGELWCVNSEDSIYYRVGSSNTNPLGTGWQMIEGKLNQISAGGNGTIVGCNDQQGIYIRNGFNGSWKQLDGAAVYAAIGSSGFIACVNAGGNVYIREGSSNSDADGRSWKHIAGNLKTISIGPNGSLAGCTENHDIMYSAHANGQWETLDGKLVNYHLGHNGGRVGVNGEGAIYRRV